MRRRDRVKEHGDRILRKGGSVNPTHRRQGGVERFTVDSTLSRVNLGELGECLATLTPEG